MTPNTANKQELPAPLPCPFCGNVGLDFTDGSTFRWLIASCSECGASLGEVRVQTLGNGTPEVWRERAMSDAIEGWNKRASTPPAAAVEAMVAVAEITECKVMGGQTVREIDGQWKFLRIGTKLYTAPSANTAQPSEATSAPMAVEAMRAALNDFVVHGLRHDPNPTVMFPSDPKEREGAIAMYTWWLTYFASAEKSVRDRASSALASHAAPVVAVGEPSYEHRHAIMEAWRNTAATAYFDHLPHNDTEAGRRSFDFAYSAAWQRKGIIDAAAHPSPVAPVEEQAKALTDANISVPRSLALKTWGFLAQDCSPCAHHECQIDGKNIGVDTLASQWYAICGFGQPKPGAGGKDAG